MNAWTLVGFGTNAAVIIMAVAWAIARRVKNASYLEVAWSYGFALVVRIYALIGPGEPLRKWLITGMVTIWSLRLGTSLLFDVTRHHPAEGHRYVALRQQFPKRPWLMFFGFSQYQAALLGLLSAPFAIGCSGSFPEKCKCGREKAQKNASSRSTPRCDAPDLCSSVIGTAPFPPVPPRGSCRP